MDEKSDPADESSTQAAALDEEPDPLGLWDDTAVEDEQLDGFGSTAADDSLYVDDEDGFGDAPEDDYYDDGDY